MMATNLVKFCTAALAGSIIGIAYERMPPSSEWPSFLQTVSAASTLIPKKPSDLDTLERSYKIPELNAESSAYNFKHSSKFGLPSNDNLRLFNDYIISYDRRLRAPSWVIEHLTPEKLNKQNANREHSKFREDIALHEYFRAKDSDFRNSGYDRGHMAAAGNHKLNQDDLDQTFALSNISPQVPEFNRGGWELLEKYVRFRAKRSKNLYVVTGPLFLPLKARDGNLYVTYRVLGSSHVSVPTHYFKVLLVEQNNGELSMEAFLMPNEPKITRDIKLDDFRVPINRLDIIERASGVVFFSQLPRNKLLAPNKLVDGFSEGAHPHNKKKIPA